MKTNTIDRTAKRISEVNKILYSPEIEEVLEKADKKLDQERLKRKLRENAEKEKFQKRVNRLNESLKGFDREI